MEYSNNHYIPQLVLRRFGTKINRFNVESGEIKIKGLINKAFSAKNIYPLWLEKELGELESKFARLIDEKILIDKDIVNLDRTEVWLIKKFFAIATLRVPGSSLFSNKHLDPEDKLEKEGFKEVKIENESIQDYAYRTLKVILDANNIGDVYDHPEVTYEACKWAMLFDKCYISIWDSSKSQEEFIITDNGMNCEHDRSRFATFLNLDERGPYINESDEMIKNGYIYKKFKEAIEKNNENEIKAYYEIFSKMQYVYANYYLFAVSSTRTISLINPFFRLYFDGRFKCPDVWPTLLSPNAFEANTCTYVEPGKFNDKDLFHYRVKDLTLEEVIIINCMMLDRVYRWLGFNESAKIVRSLNVYSMIPKQYQRKNYDKLIEYLYSLGYDFPKTDKYFNLCQYMTVKHFSPEDMEYIKYFYDLIKK